MAKAEPDDSGIRIVEVAWQSHQGELMSIRRQVFIDEQSVPEALEIDAEDASAIHLLAYAPAPPEPRESSGPASQAIGCARLLANSHFGRLAVLRKFRQSGVGKQLLNRLEMLARERLRATVIEASAQCDALAFYLKQGFYASMPIYEDAGIPHLDIAKPLEDSGQNLQQSALVLGEDTHLYQQDVSSDTTRLESIGVLLALLSQSPARIDLSLTRPQDPIWRHQQLIDGLSRYLTRSHRHRMRLLIASDDKLSEAPLMQLARRLPSRIQVRINASIQETEWLFYRGPKALAFWRPTQACAFTPSKASKMAESFEQTWQSGHHSRELRRLTI